jgi:hypothetical protein
MDVRRLRIAAGLSVAVHGAAVALVASHEPAIRSDAEGISPPRIDLVEVVTTPAAAAPEPRRAASSPPRRPQAPRRAVAPEPPRVARAPHAPPPTSPPPAAIAIGPEPRGAEATAALPAPARSALFDLRRADRQRVDLRVPGAGPRAFDAIDRVPRGTTAAPAAPATGQLQAAGGGSYRSDQGAFTARVAPDGGVALKDARNLQVGLALPGRKALGDALTRWYDGEKGGGGSASAGAAKPPALAVSGSTDAGDRSQAVVAPVARGSFDLTDALMRRKGLDPYASKKLAFLDSTRDERVRIGAAHRDRHLARTAEIMQRNLDRVWQTIADPRARREALFELWDEADPDAASAEGAAAAAAAAQARQLVIGAIRARLPPGTADAYSPAEIARLDARRRSRAPFAPYAPGAGTGPAR